MPAYGGSVDDSSFSLASVDTNPTFDQFNDGGSSVDYSSILSTGANLGMEIASAISNTQSQPTYVNALPTGSLGLSQPKAISNNAQIILVIIIALGAAWVFAGMKSA
jgi:hypothetical protein